MSDYTLIEQALELGGHVVSVTPDPTHAPFVDYAAPTEEVPPGREEDGTPTGGGTLSTVHISPHVEYRTGASILKAHRGGQKDTEPIGGIRGQVKGFSDASRRRLMQTIGGIRRDAELPYFITLTYPENFPTPEQAKKHLDTFFKRLARAFPAHGSIWKLEPQQRGAPHFHILTWGLQAGDPLNWFPSTWYEIAGGEDINHLHFHMGALGNQHCVQQVRSFKGVWSYASKYLGKTFEVAGWSGVWTGRYWGVVHRENIPFGELVQEEVTTKKALEIMRYQKRFAGLKRHGKKSQTIFCDADQWIEKIGL
ncbi:MAG TPA: hypothetical protein V6C97_27685 [Oculatellaceae cyanobacterium]